MLFEDISNEWREWLELTPIERFRESEKIFAQYLAMGGSLDPDPDPTSPFYDPETSKQHCVQAERDEASDKEKKASNHLKPANDINITAGKEHSRVVASQVVR